MILVTGGTGLVGSHLLFSLTSSGHDVVVLKRPQSDVSNVEKVFSYYTDHPSGLLDKITWRDVDLMDVLELQKSFSGVRQVYHCAAKVSFLPRDAEDMKRYNPSITANLVNTALNEGVDRFCHVSSVASLNKQEGSPTNESHIWKNDPENSAYAISKYHAEMEVWRGIKEGLNAVIVNPSLILGPGNWTGSSSTLFDGTYKGLRFYTEGTNAFVDVRDLVEIMVRLMDGEMFGKRYLVGGHNLPLRDFFNRVSDEFGVRRPSVKPPGWLVEIIWRIEWLRSALFKSRPLITRDTARSSRRKISYDSSRVEKALDFQFRGLDESIRAFCRFYLEDVQKS